MLRQHALGLRKRIQPPDHLPVEGVCCVTARCLVSESELVQARLSCSQTSLPYSPLVCGPVSSTQARMGQHAEHRTAVAYSQAADRKSYVAGFITCMISRQLALRRLAHRRYCWQARRRCRCGSGRVSGPRAQTGAPGLPVCPAHGHCSHPLRCYGLTPYWQVTCK